MRKMNLFGRKGQNTAEYAIVIALVIAAALAMQTYVKRGVQGRVHDASDKVYDSVTNSTSWSNIGASTTATLLTSKQYEPGAESKSTRATLAGTSETITMNNTSGGKATREFTEKTQEQAVGDYRTYNFSK